MQTKTGISTVISMMNATTSSDAYEHFSCITQLSMKFQLLIESKNTEK